MSMHVPLYSPVPVCLCVLLMGVLSLYDRYLGTWRTDVPAGLGCYHSARGGFYEGEFEEGMKDGWGVNTTANGRQFVGTGFWLATLQQLPSFCTVS